MILLLVLAALVVTAAVASVADVTVAMLFQLYFAAKVLAFACIVHLYV